MNYEAIIFDLDGTLWDANKSCTKAWNDVLKELNYKNKITLKGMNSVTGKPMDDCIDGAPAKITDMRILEIKS
ncbi:HAD hydrolase-like protein [Flavobacterium sp.]|uniref:HAD family hydrolase n=1 Tax=Flavobacterium sp. TaxID=239 RepID=UPI0022C93066|nr:HAD hydrolase-like protein [Flavobacterium sp.]MCZ8230401.1 HAD hydrolase-like protein [Flavobacterium sp.]